MTAYSTRFLNVPTRHLLADWVEEVDVLAVSERMGADAREFVVAQTDIGVGIGISFAGFRRF